MSFLQMISLNIEPLSIFLFSITLLYFCLIAWLSHGWISIPSFSGSNENISIKISVLIAARNEKSTLPGLIRDLEQQTYPQKNFEVIIIDDHSFEPVDEILQIRESRLLNLKVIRLPSGKEGKKMALMEGAVKSDSDLLLLTDADCHVSPRWIADFVSFQTQTNSDLIIGLVDQITGGTLASQFFRLDFLSLIASGAGSAGNKHPTMCNGANMAVKRDLYIENLGNLKLRQRSGDDVFLLHSVKKDKDKLISVLKTKESVVHTNAPESIMQFLNQRLRWASKSTSYKDIDTVALGVLVFVFNFLLIVSALGVIFQFSDWRMFVFMVSAKLTADLLLMLPALNFFGKMRSIIFLPFFHLFYPFYITITALMSMFVSYRWKNR